MFCTKCGAALTDGASFCHKCGWKLDGSAPIANTNSARNEIMNKINQCWPLIQELKQIEQQTFYKENTMRMYKKNLNNSTERLLVTIGAVLIGGFWGGWFSIYLGSLLLLSFRRTISYGAIAFFAIGAFVCAGLLMFCLTNWMYGNKRKKNLAMLDKTENEYNKLCVAYYHLTNHGYLNWIPQTYRYGEAMERICRYFMDQRVNTVQEAVNLFETEMHRIRLETAASNAAVASERAARAMDLLLISDAIGRM